MGNNPETSSLPQLLLAPQPSGAEAEYKHLLSFFKYLVTLTTIALGAIVAVGGAVFYSRLGDALDDAKKDAIKIATREAQDSVRTAFDEKH